MDYQHIVAVQRAYFYTGVTLSVAERLAALNALEREISRRQPQLLAALAVDLGKSSAEAYLTELGMIFSELHFVRRHLSAWCKPQRRPTPMGQFKAVSRVWPEPYGVVLIMAPWNYPVQLCLMPLIGALAAGNCCVIKPSAYAPASAAAIDELIRAAFPPELVQVIPGGREVNAAILECRFDYIFFTGSVAVGRLVMEKAARDVTPVSLELGGKSPCLVEKTANIELAAKRIAFGKLLNAGQTCVAPDYILADRRVLPLLTERLAYWFTAFFPDGDALTAPDWPKIINAKHFQRLVGLLAGCTVVQGGDFDRQRLKIAPTLISPADWSMPVMAEEIFGPLLPLVPYDDFECALAEIRCRPKPLALYLFTQNREIERQVLRQVSFGGGCVNDVIVQLATPHLAFGGVGESGMGGYHGRHSFDTFTHYKSVLKTSTRV
ncbi:MAG: aldehyde dehydrogenase family protein, partial [Clostridiales bacterium]